MSCENGHWILIPLRHNCLPSLADDNTGDFSLMHGAVLARASNGEDGRASAPELAEGECCAVVVDLFTSAWGVPQAPKARRLFVGSGEACASPVTPPMCHRPSVKVNVLVATFACGDPAINPHTPAVLQSPWPQSATQCHGGAASGLRFVTEDWPCVVSFGEACTSPVGMTEHGDAEEAL